MSYLIKIDFPILDYIDFKSLTLYLPIKKISKISHISKFFKSTIEIFSSIENGIIARGTIEKPALKVRDLPKEEHKYIYDKSYFQVEVFLYDYAEKGVLLKKDIFEIIPSVNQFYKVRPYNLNILYYAYDLSNEIDYLYKKKPYLLSFIQKQNKMILFSKLRLVRAEYIRRHSYNVYSEKNGISFYCSFCNIKGKSFNENGGYFFYLIERKNILKMREYIKISNENVLQLCFDCYYNECLK